MAPANLAGPSAPDLTLPSLAEPEELRSRIEAGEWVVDLRHRTAFAAGHVPGSFNFGIDGAFATYVGWLIDWGTPITLLGQTEDEVQQAQRELVRIGIDRPAAAATGTPQDWTTKQLGTFAQATSPIWTRCAPPQGGHPRRPAGGRVRRRSDRGRPQRPDPRVTEEGPRGARTPRYGCTAPEGYRASVAASFLAAAGRRLVAVDDSFDNAGKDRSAPHHR